MDKKPSFDRVIGGTPAQREDLINSAAEYSNKPPHELFPGSVVEATNSERYAIHLAIEHANMIAKYYGSARLADESKVIVVRTGALTGSGMSLALQESISQNMLIERTKSEIVFSELVFHEALHQACYQSAQIRDNGKRTMYRSGIAMEGRRGEGEYFKDAQEAIIASLTKRFVTEVIANDSRYEREIERSEAIRDWLTNFVQKNQEIPEDHKRHSLSNINEVLVFPNNELIHSIIKDESINDDEKFEQIMERYNFDKSISHERREERGAFEMKLDEIVAASQGNVSKSELFDQFARAHFTGNYLPLARVVESVLGRGSFRRLAMELGIENTEQYT